VDYTTGKGDKLTNSRFKESDIKFWGPHISPQTLKQKVRYQLQQSWILGIPVKKGIRPMNANLTFPFQKLLNNHPY